MKNNAQTQQTKNATVTTLRHAGGFIVSRHTLSNGHESIVCRGPLLALEHHKVVEVQSILLGVKTFIKTLRINGDFIILIDV